MIVVVGSRASGKRTYVESLGYASDDVSDGVMDDRPVLLNLQDALRDAMDEGEPAADIDARAAQFAEALSGKEVISCCEVGNGIVPTDPVERAWRELVGRTVNILARRADCVVRMVCGIPVVLKGECGKYTS